MKTKIILPLTFTIGLTLLGACSKTEAPKTTASNQPATTEEKSKDALPSAAQVAAAPNAAPAASSEVPATAKLPNSPTVAAESPALKLPDDVRPNFPQPQPKPSTDLTFDSALAQAATATPAAGRTGDMELAGRILDWKLRGEDIKGELENSGRITRSRTPGAGEPTGPMDSVLAGDVKNKLMADSLIAAQKIEVSADHGVVTLTGTARSIDRIGRAVAIALDTPGVTQAISTVRVDANQ